ncbi:MAG: M48 family metallopeptidase [Candidatus Omnitrophica bacterium]|nr:M48 family metallopeptidase [Candidatus Omnitrophota bacterium]
MRSPRPPIPRPPSDKSVAYARSRHRLFAIQLLWTVAGLWGLLATGASAAWAQALRQRGLAEWLVVGGYGLLVGGASTLWFLPWQWYGGWVLERRFGLSTQTWGAWAVRELKGLLVGGVVWLMVMEGLYAILLTAGRWWWAWAAAGWFLVTVVLTRLMPTVLLPIFYKTQPLADAALQRRLEGLLARLGLPVMPIYTVALSQETKKANAALAGLGRSRRILLGDTLVAHYTPEEIEVVLAHELGHHRLAHLRWHLITGAASALAGFWLVDRWWGSLAPAVGARAVTDIAAFPLMGLLLFGLSLVLLPVDNGVSRHFEFQADDFALTLTRLVDPFISAMQKLAQQNLAEMHPPGWIEWLLYDHPSIARRIRAAELIRGAPHEI